MSNEAIKTPVNIYTLTIGAASIINEILPTTQWYKEEPKQGQLICRAFAACEAIPDIEERPKRAKDITDKQFEAIIEEWSQPMIEFPWTDKEKDAVRVCVRFYLKQGAFVVTKYAIELLVMLGLNDE